MKILNKFLMAVLFSVATTIGAQAERVEFETFNDPIECLYSFGIDRNNFTRGKKMISISKKRNILILCRDFLTVK